MRRLMWFAMGFCFACLLSVAIWVTDGMLARAAVMAGVFAVCTVLSRRVRWLRRAAVLALGAAAGFAWYCVYAGMYLQPAMAMEGQVAYVTARCTDYSYETPYGSGVEGVLYLEGKPYRVKLYVNSQVEMEPGDVLTGEFTLSLTTPEGEDSSSYYQSRSIFLKGYQEGDLELSKLSDRPLWAFPAVLRKNLVTVMDSCFPEDTRGFARALLLGDRSGIDYQTDAAFQASGISHIIAVSGLHVTILFTMIHTVTLRRRWLTLLLGAPALLCFAAMAGFSPSVTRAGLMVFLMMLAAVLNRDYDGPTELAFSCLVMALGNPLVVGSTSFLLSVGCLAGIFCFQKDIQQWMQEKLGTKGRGRKLKTALSSSVSMTLSSMALTTPIVAWKFGAVSLVGVVTNLLTLWAVSIIFYGVMLVCLTGWLSLGLGTFLAGAVSWLIRYVLGVSRLLASFPLAAVYTASVYIVAWLVFCYILLAVWLACPGKNPRSLITAGILSLCLCLGISWGEPLLDACRMTVLNVGQGQCIILQSQGKTFLVDCGGSDEETAADTAAETLLSMGVFRLDGVILTHFDADHSGGLPYLLTRVPADAVYVPDVTGGEEVLEQLSGTTAVPVDDDILLSYGDTQLTLFGPALPDSGNESSIAVLFQRENCDILITGDRGAFGERMLLRTGRIPELEVLVVGHHGSNTSTCQELLDAAQPSLAVISVGNNRYGHPTQAVLDRLAAIGCPVYRTDLDGNIIIRR